MLPPEDLVYLFWTLPPGAGEGLTTADADWANLRASGVRRLQLMGAHAAQQPDILRKARDEYGIRGFSVRLNEHDYDNALARQSWAFTLGKLRPLGVDTVVLGAEVDSAFNARFGSSDWGEWRARQIRDAVYALFEDWRDLISGGLRIVTPAVMYRGHYRDWREGLQPGMFRWWEIMRIALNRGWATAAHVYGSDGTEYDTMERVRVGLWLAQSLANTPLWLGETNCDRGTDVQQMTFLVRLLSLLYWTDPSHPQRGPWAHSGERLAGFVIFAANGDGRGWGSPSHIIADIEAYRLLGQFMAGTRFYF